MNINVRILIASALLILISTNAHANGYRLFNDIKELKPRILQLCRDAGGSEKECEKDNSNITLSIKTSPDSEDPLAYACSATRCFCWEDFFIHHDCVVLKYSTGLCSGPLYELPDSGGVQVCNRLP